MKCLFSCIRLLTVLFIAASLFSACKEDKKKTKSDPPPATQDANPPATPDTTNPPTDTPSNKPLDENEIGETPQAFLTAADLKANTANFYSMSTVEVVGLLNKNSFVRVHQLDIKTESGTNIKNYEKCKSELLKEVKVKATTDKVMVAFEIDAKACQQTMLDKSATTTTGKRTVEGDIWRYYLWIECKGSELEQFNDKLFTKNEATLLNLDCDEKHLVFNEKRTLTYDSFKSDRKFQGYIKESYNDLMINTMDNGKAVKLDNSSYQKQRTVETSTPFRNGKAETETLRELYLELRTNDITAEATDKAKWFKTGEIDIKVNKYKGTIYYEASDKAPAMFVSDGNATRSVRLNN